MKTFLHYSREKQLEEGILSNIRSGLSSVGSGIQSGMAKIGNVRSSLAKSGFGGMLGQKGGSSADAFAAGAEQAKSAQDEKKQQEMQDRRDFVAAKVRQLGRSDPLVKNFYKIEAGILDPSIPRSRQQRQKELDDHYTNYTW